MPLFHLVILALIQGITEFLPISSSGHLLLAHAVMNGTEESAAHWAEDLTMDVAVHVGTLLAVLLYFRRDLWAMIMGFLTFIVPGKTQTDQNGARLLLFILIGSLPVIFAGFLIHEVGAAFLRSVELMAWCTLIFGIILWGADKYAPVNKTLAEMTWKTAFFVGLAQVLALIPGTSRSGITMTAARALGFSRSESAHFSLLLAIIAISGAGTLSGVDLLKSGDIALGLDILIAAFLSFLTALGAIFLMMRWLEKSSFTPFALYRIGLGIILLALVYSGIL